MSRQAGLSLTILVLISFISSYLPAEASEQTKDEIIQKIIDRATENEREMDNFGYDVNMKVHWLRKDGTTKKTEIRDYQTTWVEDTPRLELYRINLKPLDQDQREEQQQRRKEWQKALQNSKQPSGSHRIPFTWSEMMQKYDFAIDSTDRSAAYVLIFHHKDVDMPVRNRLEKVLNNLDGKMWVDDEYRILKLHGKLNEGVSFGLGLAKVTSLDFEFVQKPYEGLVIPVSLKMNFNVKAMLVYSDQRQITSTFSNYHLNPEYQHTMQVRLGSPISK
ncbi:MAG TPA: hypothetical protein VH815_03245 [Acidobacteriota bacterium]